MNIDLQRESGGFGDARGSVNPVEPTVELTPWSSVTPPTPRPIARWRMVWAIVKKSVAIGDILVVTGLLLLARGCYLLAPAAGWIVPGAILLWYALPERPRFMALKPPQMIPESMRKQQRRERERN